MSNEITLAQLAAEMAQIRQQIELMSQRLDMIYGAVTRLAEVKSSSASMSSGGDTSAQGGQAKGTQSSTTAMPLTAAMMMDPSSMFDSLRQYAVSVGLDVPQEIVDRLKSHSESDPASRPADETKDEQK